MATINGQPSVFRTPAELPTDSIHPTVDYETRVNGFVGIASEMATEAEMTDADWLNDPETQAELNAWYDSLDTPEAFDAYDAWVTEQERIAIETEGEMTPEEADLCSRYDAEAAELASLGDAARSYLAGHDRAWQAGVNL